MADQLGYSNPSATSKHWFASSRHTEKNPPMLPRRVRKPIVNSNSRATSPLKVTTPWPDVPSHSVGLIFGWIPLRSRSSPGWRRHGRTDRAIAALQKLLSILYESPLASNGPFTPALLGLDPMFDPLRNDPRFENSPPRPRRKIRNKVERAVPCALLNTHGVAAKS